MNFVVSKILKFITAQDVISNEADVQDFYRYGIEISISSFLNIFLVVVLGLLIHHVTESIIFLTLFISIRSFTGGYHADSYFRCNLLMCTSFILTVFLNIAATGKLALPADIALVFITQIIVLLLSPVENKNKPIPEEKRSKLKIKGSIITFTINCVGIYCLESYIGTMIIFTGLLIAILMVAAKIKEERGELYEEI